MVKQNVSGLKFGGDDGRGLMLSVDGVTTIINSDGKLQALGGGGGSFALIIDALTPQSLGSSSSDIHWDVTAISIQKGTWGLMPVDNQHLVIPMDGTYQVSFSGAIALGSGGLSAAGDISIQSSVGGIAYPRQSVFPDPNETERPYYLCTTGVLALHSDDTIRGVVSGASGLSFIDGQLSWFRIGPLP